MALTAPRIIASIYAVGNRNNPRDVNTVQGRTNSIFPGPGVSMYDAPIGTTAQGGTIVINTIIEIQPSGLTVPARVYYSNQTQAQIVTAST